MPIQVESLESLLSAMRPAATGAGRNIAAGFQGFEQGATQARTDRAAALAQKLKEAGIVPGQVATRIIQGDETAAFQQAQEEERKAAAKEGREPRQLSQPKSVLEGVDTSTGFTPEVLAAIRGGKKATGEQPLTDEQFDALTSGMDPTSLERAAGLKGSPATQATYAIRSLWAQQNARDITGGQPTRAAFGEALKEVNVVKRDAGKAKNALSLIEKTAENLGDMEAGIFGQLKSRLGVEYGRYSADPKVTAALGVLDQQLGNLARGPFAERGVLTDQDIDRVRRALGAPWLPLAQKKTLLNALRAKMAADTASVLRVAADSATSSFQKKRLEKEAQALEKQYTTWLKAAGMADATDDIPDLAARPPSGTVGGAPKSKNDMTLSEILSSPVK